VEDRTRRSARYIELHEVSSENSQQDSK